MSDGRDHSHPHTLVIVPAWNEAAVIERTISEAVSYTHLTLPTKRIV